MPKVTITFEKVSSTIGAEGYTCLQVQRKRIGNRKRAVFSFVCPEGHSGEMKWDNWKSGHRCKQCGINHRAKNRRKPFSSISQSFLKEGYQLKITEADYVNNEQRLPYTCPSGHAGEICYVSWQAGHRCKKCADTQRGLKRRTPYTSVLKGFTDAGYVLTTSEKDYKGSMCKVDYICPVGHEGSMTPNKFMRSNRRCPGCATHGFDTTKPAILYYLRFDTPTGVLYKIGITNRTVAQRYAQEPLPYTVLNERRFHAGLECLAEEVYLKRKHRASLYKGYPVLRSGNSELFVTDVLGLDRCPR